jgi:uncharacterized repeat protein (TIGR01451 family)
MKRLSLWLCLHIVLLPGLILAGNNPNSKVAIHVMSYDAGRTCASRMPDIAVCTEINTTHGGCGDFDIFPVFYDVFEYKGVEYGLEWPGSQSCTFTVCSDLHIGGITWPGDGISQVWFDCRMGPAVIPGWGWIYTSEPGAVSLIPHPHTGEVRVLDCAEGLDQPILSTSAGVCGAEGGDPCLGTGADVLNLDVYDSMGEECVLAGHYFAYTILYENTSNVRIIRDAVLKNTLPEETKFISATAGGVYISSTHQVRWQLGDVLPLTGDSVTVTARILVETLPEIDIVDMCLAYEDQVPIAIAAETTSVCPDIYAPMDLVKDDGLGGGGMAAGDSIGYTISYGNTANEAALHGVVLRDILSRHVTFKAASQGGVYNPGNHDVTWNLGTVGPGAEETLDLVVETSFDLYYGTLITNTCEMVSDETRPVQAEEVTRVAKGWERVGGLHVLPYGQNRSCAAAVTEIATCEDIETEIEGCGFVHVFPVFYDIPEFRGVSYTLIWPEDWSDMAFTSCSDITVGNIVRPHDAISQSWSTCRSGGLVIAGWAEVFSRSPGQVVMSNTGGGNPQIVTCGGRTITTEWQFACGICGAQGDDPPCGGGPTATVPTTWGAIKSMFK